mgnify:CR=1
AVQMSLDNLVLCSIENIFLYQNKKSIERRFVEFSNTLIFEHSIFYRDGLRPELFKESSVATTHHDVEP